MSLAYIRCRALHRRRWRFVQRKETGPSMFTAQRHVGIYRCEECGLTHRIVGDKIRKEDLHLPPEAPPPVRGRAMKLHEMLGGVSQRQGLRSSGKPVIREAQMYWIKTLVLFLTGGICHVLTTYGLSTGNLVAAAILVGMTSLTLVDGVDGWDALKRRWAGNLAISAILAIVTVMSSAEILP